jgi:hypothetical protein
MYMNFFPPTWCMNKHDLPIYGEIKYSSRKAENVSLVIIFEPVEWHN